MLEVKAADNYKLCLDMKLCVMDEYGVYCVQQVCSHLKASQDAPQFLTVLC